MTLLFTLMLLLPHVLVLLPTHVHTGLINQTARNGMHMEDVVGLLVTLVPHITETKAVVNDNLAVPMRQLLVLVSEMNRVVTDNQAVLGQITLSLVLGLMNILVVLPLAVQ